MSARFVEEGNILQFANDTGGALTSGDILTYNGLVIVVQRGGAVGDQCSGYVAKSPVFEVYKDPTDAEAYQTGEIVYWHIAGTKAQKTGGAGTLELGRAVPGAGGTFGGVAAANGCAATGDSLVRVRLKDGGVTA